MTPEDIFDRRLGDALRAYAADAAVEQDPMAFAASVAHAHPRPQAFGLASSWARMDRRLLWTVVLLSLLAAAVGAAVAGLRTPSPITQIEDRDSIVAGQLYGRWRADGVDVYLDLGGDSLVHGADGAPQPALGRALGVSQVPGNPSNTWLGVGSTGACGQGRYRVVFGEAPTNGPTAAPAPAGLPSPTAHPLGVLSIVDAIEFVDPVDSCPARMSILMNRTWQRLTIPLAPSAVYDSLGFSQPFHMTLPADAASGLFNSQVGTMSQFEPHELHFSHPWWNAELIDDVPVFRDVCDRERGVLTDIPGSVDAVGAWLRSAQGIVLAPPTELVVDGRRAVRWHVTADCLNGSGPVASDLAGGYEFYAIPTGDDVVLFIVRADTDNESKVAERIALAMDFD